MGETALIVVGISGACFLVVAVALTTGRAFTLEWFLGFPFGFPERIIVRRAHEPGLYWTSVCIFAAVGVALACLVSTMRR